MSRIGFLVALCVIGYASATKCESPKHSETLFSTTDGFFHFYTTVVAEFSLTCANNVKDIPLYVVHNRKAYTASTSEETSTYQISLLLNHEEADQKNLDLKVLDQEGYAAFTKAIRNGEDTSSISPLFTISYQHPGLVRKLPISSETVATVLACVGVYYAFVLKNSVASRN